MRAHLTQSLHPEWQINHRAAARAMRSAFECRPIQRARALASAMHGGNGYAKIPV